MLKIIFVFFHFSGEKDRYKVHKRPISGTAETSSAPVPPSATKEQLERPTLADSNSGYT